MQETSDSLKIDYYLELVLKHRWYLIIPFCIAMVVGITLAFVLPKMYEASALILVRPQSVSTDYVQSVVTSDVESRLNTIIQQLLSRTNLEQIINQFNLFMSSDQEDMYLEDKVTDLRDRIDIDLEATKPNIEADAFSITFTDPNPELVARIVNGLASLFINENLKVREALALGTSNFLEDEMEAMRQRLEIVEKRLKEYRQTHMGELPEQLETNLRMLDRLQMQLSERQESLRSAKDRLVLIENQIKVSQNIIGQVDSNAILPESEEAMTIAQLKQQLANLQTSYTDRHPDVVRLRNKIAELETKIQSGEITYGQPQTTGPLNNRNDMLVSNLYNDQIRQRAETIMEIKNLQVDITKIDRQIKGYQDRVENTPHREQELLTLRRDYENIQESYNNLLNRKLEADIAVNMEKKQKGEQFRIIDQARVPQRPVSPNLPQLFLLAIFMGLGLGGGLIFLKDYFDASIKSPEDIKRDMGITVFATIPKIYQKKDRRRNRINQVATVLSLFVCACLLGAFAVLVFNGIEPTIEVVRRFAKI